MARFDIAASGKVDRASADGMQDRDLIDCVVGEIEKWEFSNRSGGRIEFEVNAQALLDLPVASYEPEDCPLCREGSVALKPGSHFVRTVS